MATTIETSYTYEAGPEAVWALLTSASFARERAEQTGGTDVEVERRESGDGGVVLVITRTLPADMPSFARSFIGDTLTVTETQTWTALVDGQASAVLTLEFSAPVAIHGRTTLLADGAGTVVSTSGQIKASVPFIGGKVEELTRDQTVRYLNKEHRLGVEALAR